MIIFLSFVALTLAAGQNAYVTTIQSSYFTTKYFTDVAYSETEEFIAFAGVGTFPSFQPSVNAIPNQNFGEDEGVIFLLDKLSLTFLAG